MDRQDDDFPNHSCSTKQTALDSNGLSTITEAWEPAAGIPWSWNPWRTSKTAFATLVLTSLFASPMIGKTGESAAPPQWLEQLHVPVLPAIVSFGHISTPPRGCHLQLHSWSQLALCVMMLSAQTWGEQL